MNKTFAFILLFVFIAGASKGVSDTLQFHYGASVFAPLPNQQWWNPEVSWKNKYRDYDNGDSREAYLGSRTLFVWLTDAWHLGQTIETFGWVLALLLAVRLGAVFETPASRSAGASAPLGRLAGLFVMMLAAFYAGFLMLYGWLLLA